MLTRLLLLRHDNLQDRGDGKVKLVAHASEPEPLDAVNALAEGEEAYARGERRAREEGAAPHVCFKRDEGGGGSLVLRKKGAEDWGKLSVFSSRSSLTSIVDTVAGLMCSATPAAVPQVLDARVERVAGGHAQAEAPNGVGAVVHENLDREGVQRVDGAGYVRGESRWRDGAHIRARRKEAHADQQTVPVSYGLWKRSAAGAHHTALHRLRGEVDVRTRWVRHHSPLLWRIPR